MIRNALTGTALTAIFGLAISCLPLVAQSKAFPTNATWNTHGVLPATLAFGPPPDPDNPSPGPAYWPMPYSLDGLNQAVIRYYKQWSSDYYRVYTTVDSHTVGVIQGPITGTLKDNTGIWKDAEAISASEHTGYGMIIYALMAGYPGDGGEAKTKFDSLVRLYLGLKRSNNLMAWAIPRDTAIFKNALKTENLAHLPYSATDGDFDIAYAFLLANKQWPNDTTHGKSYLALATDMINNGIYNDLIFGDTKRIALGDWHAIGVRDGWADGSSEKDLLIFNKYVTRSSDFMFENLRAFASVADSGNRARFNDAISECYAIFKAFNDNHNKKNGISTGLISDFIINRYNITQSGGTYAITFENSIIPAPQAVYDALEEPFPVGTYSENSCRVPQRLGLDYIHTKSVKTKAQLDLLSKFIESKIPGPSPVHNYWEDGRDGYWLNGDYMNWGPKNLGNHDGVKALQFISCFVSSHVAGKTDYLGEGFSYLSDNHAMAAGAEDAYFKDTLTLKNMLAISGNWWSPISDAYRNPTWNNNTRYKVGNVVRYNNNSWSCKVAHDSRARGSYPGSPVEYWHRIK